MKREFSAGGIIFNDQGQVIVCHPTGKNYWVFPKGLIKEGEDLKGAALREVKEETGLECEVRAKVGESKYVYSLKENPGEKIFKVVVFFLMKFLSGDISSHDCEMDEVVWALPDEALKRLSFSNDKKLLQEAMEIREELDKSE